MASERKTCKSKGCAVKFSRPLGSRREYCETCRPPRKRPEAVPDRPPAPEEIPPGPIELVALAELTAASRLNTIEGQLLMRVAREADQSTGSRLASIIDRVLKAKAAALAGVEQRRNDRIDELARARANKAASA